MMNLRKITIDTYNQMVDEIRDLEAENTRLKDELDQVRFDLKIMTEYKESLQEQLNKERK